MIRSILAALFLLALASTADAAKSKTEVAAHCLSQREATALWPQIPPRYRSVNGKQCWYAPGKALPAAKKQAAVPMPEPRPTTVGIARAPEPEAVELPPDDTSAAAAALCGGPCPRFDLDEPVYRALCGGPCPDFRAQARIDTTFAALAQASGIPLYLVTRHDTTVGRGFESEDWQEEQ